MKNRGPIYFIFKDSLQINDKIMTISVGKWANSMNQKFVKKKKKTWPMNILIVQSHLNPKKAN